MFKHWTVNKIKDAVRAEGSHWFDPDTMAAFGTNVLPDVYQGPGGVFFITEDDQYDRALPKRFTVREFVPERSDIKTVGRLGDIKTKSRAKLVARNLARLTGELQEVKQTSEKFRPVSVTEQFLHDCRKHGNPSATEEDCRRLIGDVGLAKRHHKYMEAACNGTWPYENSVGDDIPMLVRQCRKKIVEVAKRLGATGVLFSGDPRGCTVKLVFEDGATNDFGKEGWCVPLPD